MNTQGFLIGCLLVGSATSVAFAQDVQQQVTGSAKVLILERLHEYTFSAIRHHDGRVTGEWQIFGTFAGETVVRHGRVTCFRILPDGKTALLGGVIERGAGFELGPEDFVIWSVRDNGEGVKRPRDVASLLVPPASFFNPIPVPTPQMFCDAGIPLLMLPNERGNIQVYP